MQWPKALDLLSTTGCLRKHHRSPGREKFAPCRSSLMRWSMVLSLAGNSMLGLAGFSQSHLITDDLEEFVGIGVPV